MMLELALPQMLVEIGQTALNLFLEMWYWLIIGIVISSAARLFVPQKMMSQLFEQRGLIAVLGATLIGVLAPFCSCTVIPLLVTMSVAGVPIAPLISFIVTSPMIHPGSFVVTAGILGWNLALARLITAFAIGFGTGLLALYLGQNGFFHNQVRNNSKPDTSEDSESRDCGCRKDEEPDTDNDSQSRGCTCGKKDEGKLREFVREMWSQTKFIGKFFVFAIISGSVIRVIIPGDWVMMTLGGQQLLSVPLAAAAGVPIYTCSVGAVPLVQVLMSMGMSPGAALAFLITGSATSIPAIATVVSLYKRRVVLVYVAAIFTGAVLSGFIYNFLI